MALNEQEKEIIRAGAGSGKTKQQVWDALTKYRSGYNPVGQVQGPVQPEIQPKSLSQKRLETIKDIPSDIKEGASNVFQRAKERSAGVKEGVQAGQSPISTIAQTGSAVAGTMSDIIGESVVTGAKLFTSPDTEKQIAEKATQAAESVVEQPTVAKTIDIASDAWNYLNSNAPETARTLRSFAGAGGLALDIVTFGFTKKLLDSVAKKAESLDDFVRKSDSVISENPTTPTPPASPLRTPEGLELEAPTQLTLQERFIGVRPDIKQRIDGKYELLSDYFTVAHARNGDVPSYDKTGKLLQADTQPTPLGYAAVVVRNTYDDITDLLQKEGSEIGATRKKLATQMFNIKQVDSIENSFRSQLDRLDLEVVNGQIRQKAGTISKLGADNDIVVLQSLWSDLQIFKQNPNLKNGIDLRSSFDSKVNFARSAQSASNSVDPISRQVRKVVADEAAKVVGPSEAARLTKYSSLMDEYKELERYVNRNAGEEYLLRLLLSGRGRESAELVNAIKETTGVDLYDHAVMSTLATDLIGNVNQKNLFRQEVTKAGLDASRALTGDPTGLINILSNKASDLVFDEESIYLRAAGAPRDFKLPQQTFPAGAAAFAFLLEDENGNPILNPEYALIIGGMSSKVARDELTAAIKRIDDARNIMSAKGLKDSHPSMKQNQKARDALVKEREKIDANTND